jgi:hypothetical protein
MSDLEVHYIELLSGNRWLGFGNDTRTSAFFINADSDSDDSAPDEYDTYMAFTARVGHRIIPFDTWVKDKICRNCNKVGHIQRDCPKARHSKSGIYQPPRQRAHQGSNRSYHHDRSSSLAPRSDSHKSPSPSSKDYSSKVKALISAVQDLALTAHTVTPVAIAETNDDTTRDTDCIPPNDYSGFLAALGCPKE